MITWCTIILALVVVNRVTAQGSCNNCVPTNNCYQSIPVDGSGQIDIRIVNPGSPVTPPVVKPPAGALCAAGTEQCCRGPGIAGCGVRYSIPLTPTTIPKVGEAQYGSQPWQASILNTDKLTYVGGGVLLNQLTVLTVAHKVAGRVALPNSLTVRFGDWDANARIEPYDTQDRVVAKVIFHPNFNAANLQNDIAILKLARPVLIAPSPNPAINTICTVDPKVAIDGRRCLVAGWGQNAFKGPLQAVMKLVDVPIIPNSACQNNLRLTRLGPTFILDTPSFICAGGEAGRDACVGDGGSGLVCNIGGRYQVVGLVSWGIGCANASIPGVYVRVANYLDFIEAYF